MIITIRNEEGIETIYDIKKIGDEQKQQEANVIVQKVGNLQVTIEALDFASRTHRANLEQLLLGCDEAKVSDDDKANSDKEEA